MKGGWKVWFQVELAVYLFGKNRPFKIGREENYINLKKRGDFYIRYKEEKDPIYIELKCINPWNDNNAQKSVLTQYEQDIGKARAEILSAIGCMLVYAVNDKKELDEAEGKIARQAGIPLWEVHCNRIGTNQDAAKRIFTDVYILYCEPKKNSYYIN